MTEWRALSDAEIAETATRLRSLDWSWRMADIPELAAEFGWRVLTTRPNWVMLDTGYGLASGRIHGHNEAAEEVELRVSDFAAEDPVGRARARDAFARMTTALTDALGEPTERQPGASAEIRWAARTTTIRLIVLSVSVHLHLVTNSYLAIHDKMVKLDRRGMS